MKKSPKKSNNVGQIGGGLQPTKRDRHDFKLGQIIKWPKLEELPESFALEPLSIKDQGDSDMCTAFATCGMSELQEGVELNPYWSFAASKDLSGDPEVWGQDIRTTMKTHIKYGAIEQKNYDKIATLNATELRYLKNYPSEWLVEGARHQKQSFFKVEGWPKGWDAYDAIRATIWLFRNLKRAAGAGVNWSWQLSDIILKGINPQGTGHMIYFRGWDNDGLILQNSYGKEAGNNGSHYLPKEEVNAFYEKFGAYVFVDKDPEAMKKTLWPWWLKVWDQIKKLFK